MVCSRPRLLSHVALPAVAAGAIAAGAVVLGRRRERRHTRRLVDDLFAAARPPTDRPYTPDDLSELPDPIRRYLSNALPTARPHIETVRLEQSGSVRVGESDSTWKPFTATQYVTVDPPGFLWDATVEVAPLLSVTVRDAYVDDEGGARVSLLGALPLDSAASSPELAEAELLRYLAEAVLYPTALLPAAGVEWNPVDDRSATATLAHGKTSVSLTFTVNDRDEVERVDAATRHRYVDGDFVPTPWSGHWADYERRNGVTVPTRGEVVWHLPEGDLSAWRGRIDSLGYGPATR